MIRKRFTHPIMMFFKKDIHALEYDATTQYKFNRSWALFWFLTMLVVPFVASLRNNIAALLILEASLWANFATHFGGMSAALASQTNNNTADNRNDVITSLMEPTNG